MQKSRNQARIKAEAVRNRLLRMGLKLGDSIAVGDTEKSAKEYVVTGDGLCQLKQMPPYYDYYTYPMKDDDFVYLYNAIFLGEGHMWIKGEQAF